MLAQLIWADYVVLGGYFVIMLGIGVYFWRFMKSMRDYFSGHNQIPWWLSGVSFYMTSFTAFLFVSYSEVAHRNGSVALTFGWAAMPAVLVGALFFSSRWRRARIDSPVEYLEERYSLGMRQILGWAQVPVRMIDNGLRLYATGAFVTGALGMPEKMKCPVILVCGVITMMYTFAGGLWAATVTDFVQFVVMMAGVLVLLPLAMARVGWFGGLVHGSPEGFFRVTSAPYTWTYLVAWFLLLLCNYNTSFGLVQRYYSVRDEREAKKTGLLVAALIVIGTPMYFLPAMAARQFLPDAASKDIYATICTTLLPGGALGLIIAAMFSATMSSLSGDYNAVAAVLTNDVYKRLIDPRAAERRLVVVGRVITCLIGVIPLSIALYVAMSLGSEVLFRKMVTVFSVAAPPIAIPMLAGLIWRRATNAGAISGLLCGVTVGLVLYRLMMRGFIAVSTNQAMEVVLTFSTAATTLAVMVGVSLLLPARGERKRRSEAFMDRLQVPVTPPAAADRGSTPSPWGAVGAASIATAVLLLAIQPAMGWNVGSKTNLAIGIVLLAVGLLMVRQSRRGPRLADMHSHGSLSPREALR